MPKINGPIDACGVCGGPVYDNRGNKPSPRSPDFKCKDRSCGEAYWLKEAGGRTGSRGGGMDKRREPRFASWEAFRLQYRNCVSIAKSEIGGLKGATVADIVASSATLWIAANQFGVKDAPAPQQPLDEKPLAVDDAEEEMDDLPY